MKHVSVDRLVALGILHEANRTFFHPIGMAIEVDPESREVCVQDHTDDPEGVIFNDGALSRQKYEAFVDFAHPSRKARLEGIGYVEQPVPGSPPAREEFDGPQDGKPHLRLVKHSRQPVPHDPKRPDGNGRTA